MLPELDLTIFEPHQVCRQSNGRSPIGRTLIIALRRMKYANPENYARSSR